MFPSLVIAYVGDRIRGLDVIDVLDGRLNRPVHVITTSGDESDSMFDDDRLDAVMCGPDLDGDNLQSLLFTIADQGYDTPIFNLTGEPAAVPSRVDMHTISHETTPSEMADTVVGELLDTADAAEETVELANSEHSPKTLGGYIAVDAEWQVTDWDPRLSSWTDIRPPAAIGEQLWDIFPEWDDSEFGGGARTVMESREPTTMTVSHSTTDRWFDARFSPAADGGIVCFLHDVTDHKGQPVGTPDDNFEDTLDRITDAFFALDNQEQFAFLNSQAEFILDVDAETVMGVRFWDAFPAAVSTTFYREFNEAMEKQEPTSFEEYYRPLDSWFEVNAYPSENGLSVFLRDITDQMRLQNRLQELHDISKELIVANSDREIAECTVSTAENVLNFPQAIVWRHNETTGQLEPLDWSDDITDVDPVGPNSEFIWAVYTGGEHRELGFIPVNTSQSNHPAGAKSELLVPVGEYGVMGAYSDERDAFDETDVELYRILASTVESALVRTRREREIARRNERLNDFASIVSHDLRNPLNVASAHAELARDADDPSTHIDMVEESLYRMEELIEDLLARARGDQELEREPLSLAANATNAWEGVDTADATLTVDGDAELDADPDRLRQLFENLYRNSIEHGRADVTVRVGPSEEGFYVEDDGPGIPAEEQDEIFEQGVTHSDDGTGFGLAIVADIVEGHGWTIETTDSEQNGARFEVGNIYSLTDIAGR